MRSILLTTTFRPFGVDNKYNRKGDDLLVDVMASRLSREPGIFNLSSRYAHTSLHLIAANVEEPVKVMEYPSVDEFIAEVQKGYAYVGITFVIKEVLKVPYMIALVRKHAPETKVVVGGFGTMVPGVDHIGADYICTGEGVRFFREILGEDLHKPFVHSFVTLDLGVRAFDRSVPYERTQVALLVGGFGCPNACEFCCTSAFYGKGHMDFFDGDQLYRTMKAIKRDHSQIEYFLIYEEDFPLHREKFERLGELIREDRDDLLIFGCFASVRTLSRYTAEELVEMGVGHVWIGVESCRSYFAKSRGRDVREIFKELHRVGITTTGSMIFGLDTQTPENIGEDVAFFISLEPTTNQLANVMAATGTDLYVRLDAEGRIIKPLNPRDADLFGETVIHPRFKRGETTQEVFKAYDRIYDTLGPCLLRVMRVYFEGYRNLKDAGSFTLRRRASFYSRKVRALLPFFLLTEAFLPNDRIRRRASELKEDVFQALGEPSSEEWERGRRIYDLFAQEFYREKDPEEGFGEPKLRETYYHWDSVFRLGAAAVS